MLPQTFTRYGVNFPLFLAPMVGLTHIGLRALVRRYLPAGAHTLFPTEMLSTRRLPTQALGKTPETLKSSDELDLIPQILGNEERFIAPSVRKLQDWGAFGIDINMGCPVRQALKHNYGVALMGDPDYAARVVEITRKHTTLPLSVKLRAGHQNDFSFLLRFCERLQEAGVDWLCLHPRLAEQKRRGHADWSQIKKLKLNLSLPLIGNGDIQVTEDIHAMFDQTQADAVMIGRALTARPWLLWQFAEDLNWPSAPLGFEGRRAPRTGEEEAREYGQAVAFMAHHLQEHFDDAGALKRLRFYLHVSHSWLNFGHSLKLKIGKVKTMAETHSIIEQFFATEGLIMSARTELRY